MEPHTEINTTNNLLLSFLSPDDRSLLAPHARRVPMEPRQVVEAPDIPIEHIYFPADGVRSVIGTSGDMEIGLIGKEGLTGLMVVLGNDTSPLKTLVLPDIIDHEGPRPHGWHIESISLVLN